ncbi:hypothetical protein Nepgr_002827 [Nepenthes gracilis]|uniref:Secreted protein n=1 Tax=Nepenthes gracilis TaxID=150966 RepID=A0AAD3P7Q2_NEPGR|nr:hypothetical protein Nepgr_002827 [Nepenthes gracilis]
MLCCRIVVCAVVCSAVRSGVSRAFFLMLNLELTFSFEVMFPADVFLSGHVIGGLPGCFVDDAECSDDAAMWTMFLAFYVAEANVAAHCALEWACEGRAGLATNGLRWLFADSDSFEISGTSLADRCCFDGNFLIVQLISAVLCAPCFGCFGWRNVAEILGCEDGRELSEMLWVRCSCPSSSVGLQKVVVDSECTANPFAPLLADCDAKLVEDLEVQCPHVVEQLVVDGLEKTPSSCSSITVDSLGLDAIRMVVDHEQPNAAPSDQVVQHHFVADEPLNSIPSLADCPGHAPDLDANY